jgi:hypothetical protein
MRRVRITSSLLVFDYFDNNANKGHGIYPLYLKMKRASSSGTGINYLGLFYWKIIMKKNITLSLLLSTMLTLGLIGCSQASNEQLPTQETLKVGDSQVTDAQEKTWQQVTVKYYDFEGGFYGLTTKAGDKLLPMNLAKKYQLPGTVLKVKGQIIKGMMTIQQWGQPFKITVTELVKLGEAEDNNKGAEY